MAWKAVIWVTVGLKAGLKSCFRAMEESRDDDGVAMDREAGAAKAAVCRSNEERTADAMSCGKWTMRSQLKSVEEGVEWSGSLGQFYRRRRSLMMLGHCRRQAEDP